MFRREIEIAVELLGRLRHPLTQLRVHDPGLAEFIRRATCNLAVALEDARWLDGLEQRSRVKKAIENVSEVYAGLQLAESWGHIDYETARSARLLLDAEAQLLERDTARRIAG
jgi:hypothetical protein